MVSRYSFLMTNDDVKCLFMSLLTIHTSSLVTGQYKSFAHFKNWVVCCLLNIVSSLYILDMNMYQICDFSNVFHIL